MSLLDKVKNYLENMSGHQYKVWGPSPNRYLWRMLMVSAPDELLPMQQVCMRPDNSIEVGFDHFPDIGSTLCKLDESKYHIYMRPSEVMRSKDPDARKAAKKLAPGPIKDCEVAEKAAKEASSKYFGKEDVIRVDFDHMGMTVNFKAEGLTDEEVLKEIERSIKALSEAWTEFLKWYYSEERKRIYGKGGLKREPPYLRYFIAEWPPNTGNPEKDREIIKDVKQKLSRNDRVYTPKGLLELKNGEITVKKSRRCAS
jgi:chemotaxis protein histidine kinase CheA